MKIKKILTFILALILACSSLVGCKGNSDNLGGDNGSGGGEAELPVEDGHGNKYVDPVKSYDGTDLMYYDGMDSYIDKNSYGVFEDLDSTALFPTTARPLDEIIGFVHAGGKYNFTKMPYLNEGSGMITKDLKSKTFKMWLTPEMTDQYSFNHEWDGVNGFGFQPKSIVDVAKSEYVNTIFSSDIKTHIMVTYEYDKVNWNTLNKLPQAKLDYVSKEFYDLTRELMSSYKGVGKTFILQNWEGDNELTPALKEYGGANELNDNKQAIIDNYLAYSNARQLGIENARAEFDGSSPDKTSDVKVYGALEINFISSNYGKQPKLIDHVVPKSNADLFSFSDWSTANVNLAADLATFKNAMPDKANSPFGENRFYLGEYGRAENLSGSPEPHNQLNYSVETMKIAIANGAQYVCYWALDCNERIGGTTTRPANADMKGFWLIRPDGHYTDLFWYFKGLLENKNYLAGAPKLVLRLPKPEPEPIPFIEENIIFSDEFDDINKDDILDIEKNEKISDKSANMIYKKTIANHESFFIPIMEKYGIKPNTGFTTLQKDENSLADEWVEYKVMRAQGQEIAKFGVQGFIYDPIPKSIIKIMAGKSQSEFENIGTIYFMDKSDDWGYLYISAYIPKGYEFVRIVFTNKGANRWNPIMCRAVFFK